MTAFTLWLVLVLAPASAVPYLGHSKYQTRERAECYLRRHLNWPSAVLLKLVLTDLKSAEAQCRLKRVLGPFWDFGQANPDALPHLDCLSNAKCSGCKCWLTRHYFQRAVSLIGAEPMLPPYRYGTKLLLDDCVRWCVPPPLVRYWLRIMNERTLAWERRQYPGRFVP